MFPGQGSQKLGMGKSFYENFRVAKDIFTEADEILNRNLTEIIFNDDQALKITTNAQPALMVVSYAIFKVLEQEFDVKITDFSYGIGHSLGEYSALTVTGALSFKDTLTLLKVRSEAMETAVPTGKGGMMACLGLKVSDIKKLPLGQVEIANDNSDAQVVLSGMKEELEIAKEILLQNGAKKVIPLDVSGPFHSSYMTPACKALGEALDKITINPPSVPVFANVTAKPNNDPSVIKTLLKDQINHGVHWRESVESFEPLGVVTAIEIGSGKVLSNLVKRINPNIKTYNIEEVSDITPLKEAKII